MLSKAVRVLPSKVAGEPRILEPSYVLLFPISCLFWLLCNPASREKLPRAKQMLDISPEVSPQTLFS